MDKSGRRFVVRLELGRAKKQQGQTRPKAKASTISAELLTKRKSTHTQKS
jgi:hypothetical protein